MPNASLIFKNILPKSNYIDQFASDIILRLCLYLPFSRGDKRVVFHRHLAAQRPSVKTENTMLVSTQNPGPRGGHSIRFQFFKRLTVAQCFNAFCPMWCHDAFLQAWRVELTSDVSMHHADPLGVLSSLMSQHYV